MSQIDHTLPPSFDSATRAAREQVFERSLLCLLAGVFEGIAAFVVVFIAALLYHLIVLDETIYEFAPLTYASYGALAGFVSGTFAATACGTFLNQGQRPQAALQSSFYAWTAAVAITLLSAFLLGKIGDLSRVSLASAYIVGVPVMLGVRAWAQAQIAGRIRRGELHFETVSVIGERIDVLNFLLDGELWRHGHKLTGTLYFEDARNANGVLQPHIIDDFALSSLRGGTDHIIFAGSIGELDDLDEVITRLKRFALNLLYAPATRNKSLKFLDVLAIGPNNVLRVLRTPLSDYEVLVKRSFDLVSAALGLLLLTPLMLVVALAIALESRGPIIFRQARRGFNGETFMIWKFRTMTVTETGHAMRQAEVNDRRITRVGRFLRRTSIDELPQLINVLRGQMSLVGPRPHAISHDADLSRQVASYAHRQRIKPGITGWAQVSGFRGETASYVQIEGRVVHDIYYIDNWSIFLDLWIIFLTAFSPAAWQNAR
jgi:Undecaprenyl-phosphate glucose phosphotransferase